VIILAIALVIVIFVSRIRFLKDRLFVAKEIDLSKNKKITELQKTLKEIKIKDESLTQELQRFNDTKVSLKSKKELILKMQEKMNLLEEKERLHLETVGGHIKDFQTLTFKYKGLKKRNEFLVEENSRFRTDNTKMLLKVREQERRIFEKLMMVHGNKEEQRKEIEKLAEKIFRGVIVIITQKLSNIDFIRRFLRSIAYLFKSGKCFLVEFSVAFFSIIDGVTVCTDLLNSISHDVYKLWTPGLLSFYDVINSLFHQGCSVTQHL
jgi:hypothetical protein